MITYDKEKFLFFRKNFSKEIMVKSPNISFSKKLSTRLLRQHQKYNEYIFYFVQMTYIHHVNALLYTQKKKNRITQYVPNVLYLPSSRKNQQSTDRLG